jgi:hypothetical protein
MPDESFLANIKDVWSFSRVGDLGGAFSHVAEVGKDIFQFVGFAGGIYDFVTVVKRDDLTRRQKILPLIGYGLFSLVSLALGVAACAAATVLLPPLIFAGSVVNVFRNIGIFFKEKAERNNLRKYFANSMELNYKINQIDLPDKIRQDLKAFLKKDKFDPDKVQELYVRIGNHFLNKTAKDQKHLHELIEKYKHGDNTPTQKNNLIKRIRSLEKSLKNQFNNDYLEVFTQIEKKQRLHYLNQSAKDRVKNIFISIGVAIVSLFTFVIPLAITATPAAPLAPAVLVGLAGVSVALGVMAGGNAMKVSYQEAKSQKAVANPKEQVADSVFPILQGSDVNVTEQEKLPQKKGMWANLKDKISSFWRGLWTKEASKTAKLDDPKKAMDKVLVELVEVNFKPQKRDKAKSEKTKSPSQDPRPVKRVHHLVKHYNSLDVGEKHKSTVPSTNKNMGDDDVRTPLSGPKSVK